MSRNRSYPFLDHGIVIVANQFQPSPQFCCAGIVALANAFHISQRNRLSHQSIPDAVVTVFVPGNDTSHATHLTTLGIRVAQMSETFHHLAALNVSLYEEIKSHW
jgi:hypothetical protein